VHVVVRCANLCVRLLRPIDGRQLAIGTNLLYVGTGEPLPLVIGHICVGLPPVATERVTEFLPESARALILRQLTERPVVTAPPSNRRLSELDATLHVRSEMTLTKNAQSQR